MEGWVMTFTIGFICGLYAGITIGIIVAAFLKMAQES
jgi:hypothetical protein